MADKTTEKTLPSCSWIHGIGSSQAIDTAGEIVDIAGLDCTALVGGPFNWEHKSDLPAQTVGKVLEYKKIFSEKDCETDAHKYFWDKCKTPFLYVMGRLFDDKKDSSKECAALFVDDAEHPTEQPMVAFSVEGGKIQKDGIVITKSIARKITITNAAANKTCVAELVQAPESKQSSKDSLFKSDSFCTIELFEKTEKYKKEEKMTKAEPMKKPTASATNKPAGLKTQTSKTIPAPKHWSGKTKQGSSGVEIHFHHPEFGQVTVHRDRPSGDIHVKHNGGMANVGGVKGSFKTPKEAHEHSHKFMNALVAGTTSGNKSYNRSSPEMIGKEPIKKAMSAGSGMAGPGNLVQGAALGKESLDGKMKKAEPSWNSNASSGKSELLKRAKEEYSNWSKREAFEDFMAKKMPNLTKSEIKVIGQTVCLRKSLRAEKKLAKMIDQGQKSYFEKKIK